VNLHEAVALVESYPPSPSRERARAALLNGGTDRPPNRVSDPTPAQPGIGLTWYFGSVHETLRFREDGYVAVSSQSAYPITGDDYPTIVIPPAGG
jgi:hypothetical protein